MKESERKKFNLKHGVAVAAVAAAAAVDDGWNVVFVVVVEAEDVDKLMPVLL